MSGIKTLDDLEALNQDILRASYHLDLQLKSPPQKAYLIFFSYNDWEACAVNTCHRNNQIYHQKLPFEVEVDPAIAFRLAIQQNNFTRGIKAIEDNEGSFIVDQLTDTFKIMGSLKLIVATGGVATGVVLPSAVKAFANLCDRPQRRMREKNNLTSEVGNVLSAYLLKFDRGRFFLRRGTWATIYDSHEQPSPDGASSTTVYRGAVVDVGAEAAVEEAFKALPGVPPLKLSMPRWGKAGVTATAWAPLDPN